MNIKVAEEDSGLDMAVSFLTSWKLRNLSSGIPPFMLVVTSVHSSEESFFRNKGSESEQISEPPNICTYLMFEHFVHVHQLPDA